MGGISLLAWSCLSGGLPDNFFLAVIIAVDIKEPV